MDKEKIVGVGDWDEDGNYVVYNPETKQTITYESKEAYLETLYGEDE